jgi:GNAT superfamily N-acetyltransferase
MLQPAHVGHLSILRALIRDGAMRGSFDRELASASQEAASFFLNLRRALTTGYFVEQAPGTQGVTTVAVPGYVYLPDRAGAVSQPIGFGLFKTIDPGYELWLTGIDAAWRGHGHGRAMFTALLSTPPGRNAYVVRVHRFGRDSPAMTHLLTSFTYSEANVTAHHSWFVRADAPSLLAERMRAAPSSQSPKEKT